MPMLPTQHSIVDSACAEEQAAFVEPSISTTKTWTQKATGLTMDIDDDEETTDVGQSSASETESSSGFSGNEGGRTLNKRCRFGKTTLETIPATPSAGSKSVCRFGTTPFETVPKTPTGGEKSHTSPPGLSHTAMRHARDACQPGEGPTTSDAAGNLCRFGTTAFDTVPKTPVGGSKWKALKNAFGSPPGLSRADMRQERDACRGEALTSTSWGTRESVTAADMPAKQLSAAAPEFQPASCSAKLHAPRQAFLRIKQEAARLKDLKVQRELDHGEEDMDESLDSSSEEESSKELLATIEDQRCRFESTALGTVPKTPVGGQASLASPPGLSRAAMRQARDARKAGAASAGVWQSCTGAVLTISSCGKPMTPPATHAAKVCVAKDAPCTGEASLLQLPR